MRASPGVQSVIYLGGTGCLLAMLAVFNLFFGWIIFKPRLWLLIEALLLLLLSIHNRFLRWKIKRSPENGKKVIDTDAEVIE